MRALSLLSIIFFLFRLLPAQVAPYRDSLLAQLSQPLPDTSRIQLLNDLSFYYAAVDMDSAIEFANEALSFEKKYPDDKRIAKAHVNMGHILSNMGRYSEQIVHMYHAREISERINDQPGVLDTYNHLAGLFYNLKMYAQARIYWVHCLEVARKIGAFKNEALSLNNLGSLYAETDKLDSAVIYYKMALQIQPKTGLPRLSAVLMENIGDVYLKKGNLEEALAYTLRSFKISDSLGVKTIYSSNANQLGKIAYRRGDMEEAVFRYHQALRTARSIDAMPREADALLGLAETYARAGRNDSSVFYYTQHAAVNDSLARERNNVDIGSDLFQREQVIQDEKKKLADQRVQMQLDEKDRKSRETRLYFLAGIGALFAVALIFFFRYRANRRAAARLEAMVKERTRELVERNIELNTFIYQSSHDLRSPITSILGLAGIALRPGEDKERYVMLIRDRAAHLDGIYSELIHSMNIRERDPVLQEVQTEHISKAAIEELNRLRPGHGLRAEVQADQVKSLRTDPWMLSQILRVALLNAADFCDSAKESYVRISFERGSSRVLLRIEDNGDGIPDAAKEKLFRMFSRGSNRSRGSGLGLYNAKLAVTKLKGSISIESEEGRGSVVRVELPG